MHFNPGIKVLSIHYYESPYSLIDYGGLSALQRYIDSSIVNNKSKQIYNRRKKKGKYHLMLVKQRLGHRFVSIILKIDWRC